MEWGSSGDLPATLSGVAAGQAIADLPLFAGVDQATLSELLSSARLERHLRGAILFEQGREPAHLHVLLSGSVELFASANGHECGILLLSAPDVFMIPAVIYDEVYVNSARALEPSKVLLIDASLLRKHHDECGRLCSNMNRALAGQHRMMARHIVSLKSRGAAQRLCAFLLRLVDDAGPGATSSRLPWPKHALATRLGMSAETLSRSIQIVAEHGLHLRGQAIVVRDRSKADAFCGSAPWLDSSEVALGVHAR